MLTIHSYPVAVALCMLTMICWGSWANTQKLSARSWRFELFYWDFVAGLLLTSLLAALTLGSMGNTGRTFLQDLAQADVFSIAWAMLGGAVWNAGNLLLVAAIAVAGMAIGFPIGGGIAWVFGILVNFILVIVEGGTNPGNSALLFAGVAVIVVAIALSIRAYSQLAGAVKKGGVKGILLSVSAGLSRFLQTCRVVKGLSRTRIGAIGARPNAFNTTRYSEKLFENAGVSTNTIDLSEIFGDANRIADNDARVSSRIELIRNYADTSVAPFESLARMAKFAIVVDDWMDSLGIEATAMQCWSSLQKNFGVNVCTIMSMMSQRMMPSACEVDIAGVISMYALQLASGRPSGLVDWNNNYGGNPNKCVLFHCGNWATEFLPDAKMGTAEILGSTLGEENTGGTLVGRTNAGPLTIARVSTDDLAGCINTYVAQGEFTDDPLNTFGARAVVNVLGLPNLMQVICQNGFEHHAAMSRSHCADAVAEAFSLYKGWRTHHHNRSFDLPRIPTTL